MDTKGNTHIPFAQLPLEACALFYFQSLLAVEYHLDVPHTSAEIFSDLERIWNAEKLTVEDLRDWDRLSDLLKAQLPNCDPLEMLIRMEEDEAHIARHS